MGLSYWQLISGDDIPIEGIGTVVPPHLRDLRNSTGIGYQKYLEYISVFVFNIREQALDNPEIQERCVNMDAALKRDFTTFDFYIINDVLTAQLETALSFFIKEKIVFAEETEEFLVYNKSGEQVGSISYRNYTQLSEIICEVCNISIEREEVPKNKSDFYMALWMKRRAGRKAMRKTADKNFTIENIVSALSARHPSLNILNIWDLTVCQLYDQFQHISTNEVSDRLRLRWAAWGKDDFEHDKLWYLPNKS